MLPVTATNGLPRVPVVATTPPPEPESNPAAVARGAPPMINPVLALAVPVSISVPEPVLVRPKAPKGEAASLREPPATTSIPLAAVSVRVCVEIIAVLELICSTPPPRVEAVVPLERLLSALIWTIPAEITKGVVKVFAPPRTSVPRPVFEKIADCVVESVPAKMTEPCVVSTWKVRLTFGVGLFRSKARAKVKL